MVGWRGWTRDGGGGGGWCRVVQSAISLGSGSQGSTHPVVVDPHIAGAQPETRRFAVGVNGWDQGEQRQAPPARRSGNPDGEYGNVGILISRACRSRGGARKLGTCTGVWHVRVSVCEESSRLPLLCTSHAEIRVYQRWYLRWYLLPPSPGPPPPATRWAGLGAPFFLHVHTRERAASEPCQLPIDSSSISLNTVRLKRSPCSARNELAASRLFLPFPSRLRFRPSAHSKAGTCSRACVECSWSATRTELEAWRGSIRLIKKSIQRKRFAIQTNRVCIVRARESQTKLKKHETSVAHASSSDKQHESSITQIFSHR